MKEKREGKKSLLDEQPGPEVRREDPETRRHDDEDHRLSTDSPRWSGEPEASEEERGAPPEGGEPVRPGNLPPLNAPTRKG